MSCVFHVSPLAPPSHNVRPVTSVPSLGARTFVILRLDGSAGSEQRLDHLQVAFPSHICQRPPASVESSAANGDGTCQVTGVAWEDFRGFRVENWEFGPPFLIETCIFITTNQKYNQSYHVSPGLGSRTSAMAHIQIKSHIQIDHHPRKKSFENIENPFASICHNQFY